MSKWRENQYCDKAGDHLKKWKRICSNIYSNANSTQKVSILISGYVTHFRLAIRGRRANRRKNGPAVAAI
jgi:hypothetical protein